MSSISEISLISPGDMALIRSVLLKSGYAEDFHVGEERKFNAAVLLLMKLVLSGENSPQVLADQLEWSFGKPVKEKALYRAILPRYAIQGLPGTERITFHSLKRLPLREQSELQAWENEGGVVGSRG